MIAADVASQLAAAAYVREVAPYVQCEHPDRELRRRTTESGAEVFAHQCLTCGQARVQKKSTIHPDLRAAAPPFDEGLSERYYRDRTSRWREAYDVRLSIEVEQREVERREAEEAIEAESDKWWAWYNDYLRSPAWRVRRALVMRRAGGTCEGCLSAPATQVHHATYDHVGNELLFELHAICDDCHERAHESKRRP
jgi:5-methylcytosine-specific restriction endonuclease McrA